MKILFQILLTFALALAAKAQDSPSVKVMRLDKLELAPGIVTKEVAARFQAQPKDVESRLRGAVLATLAQEL